MTDTPTCRAKPSSTSARTASRLLNMRGKRGMVMTRIGTAPGANHG